MTVISKFYGIAIRMLFSQSLTARFHALYGQWELVVGIAPLRIIQGEAPARVCSMVMDWAAQHRHELQENWELCRLAAGPKPILPLY